MTGADGAARLTDAELQALLVCPECGCGAYWNQYWHDTARLVIRTRPETEWRRAADAEGGPLEQGRHAATRGGEDAVTAAEPRPVDEGAVADLAAAYRWWHTADPDVIWRGGRLRTCSH